MPICANPKCNANNTALPKSKRKPVFVEHPSYVVEDLNTGKTAAYCSETCQRQHRGPQKTRVTRIPTRERKAFDTAVFGVENSGAPVPGTDDAEGEEEA